MLNYINMIKLKESKSNTMKLKVKTIESIDYMILNLGY